MIPDEKKLNQVIFQALRSALSLTAREANVHLIRSYSNPPPTDPEPSRNYCYFHLTTDNASPILQERETLNSQAHVASFIPCRLALVFYGPGCESWAHRCRSFLYLDGSSHPLRILRDAGLYPIPSPDPPDIVFEELTKVFRKRADLVIFLRLLDDTAYGPMSGQGETPEEVDTIISPPDVRIHSSVT